MNPSLLVGKKAIVFIDDILGTGFSIRETIENFAEYCGEKNLDDYLIYVTGILITKRAVRYLSKKVRKTKITRLITRFALFGNARTKIFHHFPEIKTEGQHWI